jgi:hypothetical protein
LNGQRVINDWMPDQVWHDRQMSEKQGLKPEHLYETPTFNIDDATLYRF